MSTIHRSLCGCVARFTFACVSILIISVETDPRGDASGVACDCRRVRRVLVMHCALLLRRVVQVIDDRALVLMIPEMEPEQNPAIGIKFNCE